MLDTMKHEDYAVELRPGQKTQLTVYGPRRVRFHSLFYGKWISNRQTNGEFDYYFVIELLNWQEAVGNDAPPETYNVSLAVVSPQEAGKENCRRATDCCGMGDGQCEEVLVEALHGYGLSVPVWSKDGNNYKQLMCEARREAQIAASLFGCREASDNLAINAAAARRAMLLLDRR